MSVEKAYAAMRNSAMREWVGGGDPEAVGRGNFASIVENIMLKPDFSVLDFGCGIGRTSAALAEFLKEGGQLVGTDIIPAQIQFCREQIGQFFPNTTFHCIQANNQANNPLYGQFVSMTQAQASTIDEREFFSSNDNRFDTTVGFSVFTHFNPTMAAYYLRALNQMTKPTGHLLLTWFLDHLENPSQLLGFPVRLGSGESFADPSGSLVVALYSPTAVAHLAADAGLRIERISYGYWRRAEWAAAPLKGQHYQDIVILRRRPPRELSEESAARVRGAL
jgi:SAM-dependent methyltransferase